MRRESNQPTVWERLRAKGIGYWIAVAAMVALGLRVGHLLEDIGSPLIEWRYGLFQWLTERGSLDASPWYTVVVEIGDEEYWKGPLARRVPIKRDWLAQLVKTVVEGQPRVIALDFDFRSPTPEGQPAEHPDYQAERDRLVQTVLEVARQTAVVIPKTIALDSGGHYIRRSDIYSGTELERAGSGVRFGFIALAHDKRRVPTRLDIQGEDSKLDSFPLAIARVMDPPAAEVFDAGGELPIAHFLRKEKFNRVGANEVLDMTDQELLEKFHGKAVIVGGTWNRTAYGTGGLIDLYETPLGKTSGVYIHANHAAAITERRVKQAASSRFTTTLEIALALLGAIAFALQHGWLARLLSVAGIALFTVFVSYVALTNFFVYLDAITPLVLVLAHALWDELREVEIRRKVEHEISPAKE